MSRLTYSWIFPGVLAVGPCPDTAQLTELQRAGITAVLNLQDPAECPLAKGVETHFRFHRLPTPDGVFGLAPELEWLQEAVLVLRQWRRQGLVSYVHCYAGQGRSPLVCMGYLMAEHQYTIASAITAVKIARPIADPNPRQIAVLCQYALQVMSG